MQQLTPEQFASLSPAIRLEWIRRNDYCVSTQQLDAYFGRKGG